MSESLYDFRAALSGEPEAPAEGEEQAELLNTLSSQQTGSVSGSGGAPFSLNLTNGLLMMTNGSGTVEVDTADERVVIDPESPSLVGQRDGSLVLGATAEGSPLLAARTVRGEMLEPVREGVPASVEGTTEGVVTEPLSEPFEAPVHVVSVRPTEQSDLVEAVPASEGVPATPFETARLEPVMEGIPAVEAEPVSVPVEAVPVSAPTEESGGESGDVTGPVVTVDPETGETVILAEDLRITVGPEDGRVRIEPSEENVPLGPDADPITVDAGGLTMVIDPATGTLEVSPVEDRFTDVTVEIGDLRIVMDGETGEVSVDPGEGTVEVDPETGLITIEPVAEDEDDEEDEDSEDDDEDRPAGDGEGEEGDEDEDRPAGDEEGEEEDEDDDRPAGDEEGEEGGEDEDRPAGDEEGVTDGEDHEGGDDRYHPDDRPAGDVEGEEDEDRPAGDEYEVPVRPGQDSGDGSGTVPGGTVTPVGSHTGDEGTDPTETEELRRLEPYTPEESGDGPFVSGRRVPGEQLPGEDGGDGEDGEDTELSRLDPAQVFENDVVEDPGEDPPADEDYDVPVPQPTGGTTGGSGSGDDEEETEGEEDEEEEGEEEEEEEEEDGEGEGEDEEEEEEEGAGGEGDGEGDGSGSGGGDDSSDKGTKIDLIQIEAFKDEFIVKVRDKLDEHTPNYYTYGSSSGNSESASQITRLGNSALLENAGTLSSKIDTSMSNLYGIMTAFQKELKEIQSRIDANINTFRELEEDQALNAAQVSYLMNGQQSSGGTTP